MENKAYYDPRTIPATIKVADGSSSLQSKAHSGGSTMTVASQASAQDLGTRVLPVLYIQGSGPPVRVGTHIPVPSTSAGHQKITSRPVPSSQQITLVTTFTQPTLVQTYSQAALLPSTPTLLSSCSSPSLLSTNTQLCVSKCSQPSTVPTCYRASQSALISTSTRPIFVSSVTRPAVIPSLVPSTAQFLPPLAPKPPIVCANASPNCAKTTVGPPPSTQMSTSQRIMIQTSQAGVTSTVKSPSYTYVRTLLRQEVKSGDSSKKILLANVPLPLSASSGSCTTSQQHKMTSLLLPVTIPTQVNTGKTSVINLKIANRHILPDGKASVTVLRETPICPQPPPLLPISKPPRLVTISSGQVILDKPRFPSKDQNQVPPLAPMKPNPEKQVEAKIPVSNDKQKKNRELSKCLKDAVDAIFYLKQSDDSKSSPKKQKGKQKQKEDLKEEPTKQEVNEERDIKGAKIDPCDSSTELIQKNKLITSPLVQQVPQALNDIMPKSELEVADKRNQSLPSKEETVSKLATKLNTAEKNVNTGVKLYHKTDIQSQLYSEDFDPVKILEWKDGIGTLPGSDLKFRMNEFNIMEIVSADELALIVQSKKKETSRKHVSFKETKVTDVSTVKCGKSLKEREKGTVMKKVKTLRLHKLHSRRKKLKRLLHLEQLRYEAELKNLEERLSISEEQKNNVLRHSGDETSTEANNKPTKKLLRRSGKSFIWAKYFQYCKAKAAPLKLFKYIFPYGKNGFKLGMKLEGIDPEHPAYYCILTVVDIQGYRIRLNFDGYSDMYDFWVNADSMDIFPVGWCERNGHELHPPKNYKNPVFNWNSYLKSCKAQAAPKHLFTNKSGSPMSSNGFRLGMKLEAVDRKNSYLVCVATVADLMDNRILVHFDSWDDIYDYWADPSSPYIHPVGWCEQNGHTLTPPLDYKPPESFSWDHYLKETKSQAVPARAFKQRPPCGFRPGMKMECVDKWVPRLIRMATVEDVSEHQIKILFDGWSDVYSYWVDDDSPDIHPVGWCQKTGHDLEPPLTPIDKEKVPDCLTRGCLGLGNVKGPKYSTHHTSTTCPYAMENLQKDNLISDRLYGEKGEKVELPSPEPKPYDLKLESNSSTKVKLEPPSDDLSRKDFEEDTIARRLRKSSREKDQHTESESLPVKTDAVSPVLRSMKSRKLGEKEDDPDWSLEMEKSSGKRKCEKEECTPDIVVPKIKAEGKVFPRPSKQRRIEVSEEKPLLDVPQLILKREMPTTVGVKRRSYNEALDLICGPKKTSHRDHISDMAREAVVNPANEPDILRVNSYLSWAKHYEYLDFYTAHIDPDEFVSWSASEVAQFVNTVPGCEEKAYAFVEQEIDGEVFLLLSLMDLVRRIGLKLGPALKLYNCINMIRMRTVRRD